MKTSLLIISLFAFAPAVTFAQAKCEAQAKLERQQAQNNSNRVCAALNNCAKSQTTGDRTKQNK